MSNQDSKRRAARNGPAVLDRPLRPGMLAKLHFRGRFPPPEPRSSGRESAPSELGGKCELTHVGGYGSGVQSATFVSGNSFPGPERRLVAGLRVSESAKPVTDRRSARVTLLR